jgi:pyruvate/2-oxoglutarate/acetoin dehydrogenase E1 component
VSQNIAAEVIDVRILNPFDAEKIIASVKKTKSHIVAEIGFQ